MVYSPPPLSNKPPSNGLQINKAPGCLIEDLQTLTTKEDNTKGIRYGKRFDLAVGTNSILHSKGRGEIGRARITMGAPGKEKARALWNHTNRALRAVIFPRRNWKF